ncbi:MAG: hypothetical protein HC905_12010 [Bacteroidales bacterium]|nr:hypothetical protein [Bacteroidales bacterium]
MLRIIIFFYDEILRIQRDSFCLARDTITLTEPPPLKIYPKISDYKGYEIDCINNNTGSITIDSTRNGFGTYSYNWSTSNGSGLVPANKDQTNLSAGTYNLTVTYGGVCPRPFSFTLDEPSAIRLDSVISDFKGNNVSCFQSQNGYININPSGSVGTAASFVYNWSTVSGTGLVPASRNQKDLGAGTYHLQITDENLCKFDWD